MEIVLLLNSKGKMQAENSQWFTWDVLKHHHQNVLKNHVSNILMLTLATKCLIENFIKILLINNYVCMLSN